MRPLSDVQLALRLSGQGLSTYEIARKTGIPASTVWNWVSSPARALARGEPSSAEDSDLLLGWGRRKERSYAYLFGVYLGDGHIVRVGRTFRLSIYGCDAYPGILNEVETAIGELRASGTVTRRQRQGCVEVACYWTQWPRLFPQHGPGRKHERPIVLAGWQQEIADRHPRPLLRGLIHSDGCRSMNVAIRHTDLAVEYRHYSRYQFTNRSEDILRIFCHTCDSIGVHWTRMNRVTISIARRDDVHHLDSFVGPKR